MQPMKRLLIGIKSVLLWSYERGTWQYDLLCLLIIAAIFLIPSSYFGDRDRPLRTALAVATTENGEHAGTQHQEGLKSAKQSADLRHWDVEVVKLNTFATRINQPEAPKQNTGALLELYLREKIRIDITISHFEPQYDHRGMLTGYRVWFK